MKPFGRHKHRSEDDTKMNHKEIGCEDMDWGFVAQGRDQWWALVNTVMNLCVLWGGGFLDKVSDHHFYSMQFVWQVLGTRLSSEIID
jgi:hypothetical protein